MVVILCYYCFYIGHDSEIGRKPHFRGGTNLKHQTTTEHHSALITQPSPMKYYCLKSRTAAEFYNSAAVLLIEYGGYTGI